MLENLFQFKEQINLLLGAAIAYIGFYVQGRVAAQQTRSKLLLEKLERAYLLCQLVYDGHKREVTNAAKNYTSQREEFLKSRKHPGQEMSELKMLLRCYAPDLISFESKLDEAHKPLKDEIFKRFDDTALSGVLIDSESFDAEIKACYVHLDALGKSTASLKKMLAEKANLLVR